MEEAVAAEKKLGVLNNKLERRVDRYLSQIGRLPEGAVRWKIIAVMNRRVAAHHDRIRLAEARLEAARWGVFVCRESRCVLGGRLYDQLDQQWRRVAEAVDNIVE